MKGLTRRNVFAAPLRKQAMAGRVKTFTHCWRSGLALKDLHVCTPARIISSNNECAAFTLPEGYGYRVPFLSCPDLRRKSALIVSRTFF
jgi:hypothetical protein